MIRPLALSLLALLLSWLLAALYTAPAFAQGTPARPGAAPAEPSKVAATIAALEPLIGDPQAPPEKLTVLGVLYLETGRAAEALAVLAPLARAAEAKPVVLYHAGRAALVTGNSALGEEFLSRASAAAPESPASRELGLLRGRLGQTEGAYELLHPWCLGHLEDLEACRAAAALALRFGRTAEAEPLLVGLPSERPGVRLLRGELLLQQGKGAEALEVLLPLLAKHPPVMATDVARVTADAFLRNGRPADAVAVLQGKVGEDPRLALLLGRAHFQDGNATEALAVVAPFVADLLARSLDDTPHDAVATDLLLEHARWLVTSGKSAVALPALERLTQIAPNEPQGWQLFGQALAATGRRPEAERALAEFQRLSAAEPPPAN